MFIFGKFWVTFNNYFKLYLCNRIDISRFSFVIYQRKRTCQKLCLEFSAFSVRKQKDKRSRNYNGKISSYQGYYIEIWIKSLRIWWNIAVFIYVTKVEEMQSLIHEKRTCFSILTSFPTIAGDSKCIMW